MKDCDKWKQTPHINPRTNRRISPTGKVYKELERDCGSPKLVGKHYGPIKHTSPPRKGNYAPFCDEWFRQPHVNPRTGRAIKVGGPTFKAIEKECGDSGQTNIKAQQGIKVQQEPSDEECFKWLNDPTHNPRTGRVINPKGKVFKMFKESCDKTSLPSIAPTVSSSDVNHTWFQTRIETGRRIINHLNDISSDQWDMCMTGSSAPIFRKNFSNVKVIGRGTFGQIFKADFEGDDVVIKEAYLRPKEKRVLKQDVTANIKWGDIPKNTYPVEYRFMNMVNDLLLTQACPNFLYTYNMAVCDGCKVKGAFKDTARPTSSCYVSFMEPAESDLSGVVLTSMNEQRSVFYQLLLAVHAIHKKYALFHRDIKSHNVLVQRIQPGGHFEYVVGNKTYYIENTGIVVYLADFGVASCYSPIYGTGASFGFRNAEVMRSSTEIFGSNLFFQPFKTQHDFEIKKGQVSIVPPFLVDWKDNQTGEMIESTMNQFNRHVNVVPDRAVNINDNSKFPPFEFFNDIQDVVRIFIGGKQTVQPGDHPPMNLDPDFKAQLTNECFLTSEDDVYNIFGTVKYILAEEMLDKTYVETARLTDIVDTFFM